MKPVGIIILNWNGAALLRRYLPSVVAANSNDIADVVVVDNGSTDESLSVLKQEFPDVRTLCFDKNYGYAEGYNRAIRELGYRYSVLLNSDVAATPEWIRPLYEYMEAHPEVAACQPKILSDADHTKFEYAGASGGFIDKHGYPFCRGRIFDTVETDNGFWLDLGSGEIYCTRNIRPVKASKYIKQEDSATGIYHIPVLCRYPGGLNPRVRWESAEISAPDYSRVLEKAGTSIAEAVKTAKNDLKNTLSEPYAGVLLRFDEIQLADKRRAVLKLGEESITLQAYYRQFPNCCDVLEFVDSRRLHNGALFGLMYYAPEDHRIFLCPMSIVHADGITKLC